MGKWSFYSPGSLLVAELGSRCDYTLFSLRRLYNTVSWYKHSVGKKPLLIAYSDMALEVLHIKMSLTIQIDTLSELETDSFNLTIIHLEEYDFATYYCAVSFLNILNLEKGQFFYVKVSS